MVKAEDVARAGRKYIGTSYSQMDCQAFVERCLRDEGIKKNLAGSNAWYREMSIRITPEECKKRFGEIPRGCFLFIVSDDGKEPARYHGDKLGNASHIGIYTGETAEEMLSVVLKDKDSSERQKIIDKCSHGNGALHSSSSRGCVCTSKFAGKSINGGWNYIGLWRELWYDNPAVQAYFGQGAETSHDQTDEQSYLVSAPNGGVVNLRANPSKSSVILERVPTGSTIMGKPYSDDWTSVHTASHSGYMMSEFLRPENEQDTTTYRVTISGVTWDQYRRILSICPMAEVERE